MVQISLQVRFHHRLPIAPALEKSDGHFGYLDSDLLLWVHLAALQLDRRKLRATCNELRQELNKVVHHVAQAFFAKVHEQALDVWEETWLLIEHSNREDDV